eukprot:2749813-Amphidinium_carterae.1
MMKSSPDFDAEKDPFKTLQNTMQGKALIMQVMELYRKETRKPAALSELSVFSSFRHLLTATDVDLIAKLRDARWKGSSSSCAVPKPATKSKAKPANAESAENLNLTALARMRKSCKP